MVIKREETQQELLVQILLSLETKSSEKRIFLHPVLLTVLLLEGSKTSLLPGHIILHIILHSALENKNGGRSTPSLVLHKFPEIPQTYRDLSSIFQILSLKYINSPWEA